MLLDFLGIEEGFSEDQINACKFKSTEPFTFTTHDGLVITITPIESSHNKNHTYTYYSGYNDAGDMFESC